MGLAVEADPRGNLLTRINGRSDRTVLLCAHLDTVDVHGEIEPVVVDGGWENAHDTILGADNKAAVAVFLEVARRASVEGSPVAIELLLTVEEEDGLRGAKAFDASVLRADFGYVLDHATPIGEVVIASPTYYRLSADFHGRAAHAGIRPEDGRSAILAAAHAIAAMPHGRIDDQTTANVGSIQRRQRHHERRRRSAAALLAEARSLDPDRVEDVIARMIDAVHDGAAAAECDVDVVSEKLFDGYRTKGSAPAIVAAEAALSACGYEPQRIVTGGGSDANALMLKGIECVNLANGTERNHEPTERVSVAALEGMFDVCLALLDEAARSMSSRFERLEARTVFEGAIVDVREGSFRHEDGEEVTRQWVAHPGSVGIVAHDGEHVWLVRQPREAAGEPDLLELPAGKLDEEGESPLECGVRELAEEIGKAAAELGAPDDLLHVGGLHRRALPHLPRDRPERRARAADRGRADRHRARTRSPSSTPRSPPAATRRR